MVLFFQVSRPLFCFYIVNVSCHLFLDFQCHLFQDCQLSPIKLPGSTRRPHLTGGEGRAQHRQLDISIVLQGATNHNTRSNIRFTRLGKASKKKSIFLGNSPKQRTPPTHPYGLGLT